MKINRFLLFIYSFLYLHSSSFSINQTKSTNIFINISLHTFSVQYVDDNNDSGPWDGTEQHPYQTIADGLSHAAAGDTVLVRPGLYHNTSILQVGTGVTLYLDPGVVHQFDDHAGYLVQGNLQALGTVADSIIFSHTLGNDHFWKGIQFVNSSTNSELRFCRIEQGNGTDGNKGGAIYCNQTELLVSHCLIQNNSAAYGAGVFCENGSIVQIEHCQFTNNLATISGGALFSTFSSPFLYKNIFQNNQCNGSLGGGAVAIYDTPLTALLKANRMPQIASLARINANRIEPVLNIGGIASLKKSQNNRYLVQSVSEGSIYWNLLGKQPVIEGNSFIGNSCSGNGGAVFIDNRKAIIYDNSFENNQSSSGGSLYTQNADSLSISWNIFNENQASANGGAIYIQNSQNSELARNIYLHNSAADGGGIYLSGTTLHSINNTLFGNQASNRGSGIYSASGANSLVNTILWDFNTANPSQITGAGLQVQYSNVEGGYSGTGNINSNPLFIDTTKISLQLQPGSPCVNSGDPTTPFDPDSSISDMGVYNVLVFAPFDEIAITPDTIHTLLGASHFAIRFNNPNNRPIHTNEIAVSSDIIVPAQNISSHGYSDVYIKYNSELPDTMNLQIQYGYNSYETLSILSKVSIDPIFKKIEDDPITLNPRSSYAACWGDYDNDGFDDLFVANSGQSNLLFHNEGSGNMSLITQGSIVTDVANSISATWGDYDNDGDLDLFVANYDQDNALYENNGNGSFTKVITGVLETHVGYSTSCSWVDYDLDGFLDLYVTNRLHSIGRVPNSLYHNNQNKTFTQIENSTIIFESYGGSRAQNWGDYDNDGYPDLCIASWEKGFEVFHNNSGSSFTKLTSEIGTSDGASSYGCAWLDVNNDGFLDLYVIGSYTFNPKLLFLNNRNGTFTKTLIGVATEDHDDSQSVNWADYDNDGDKDIIVGNLCYHSNGIPGLIRFFSNQGDASFIRAKDSTLIKDSGSSFGCAWSDYDNDGDMDLFVANPNYNIYPPGRQSHLYKNLSKVNHWLGVKCVGTASNKSAIGAKVLTSAVIFNQPIRQMMEISGQTGTYAQNSLRAHFGLGNATIVDSVIVKWPSGLVQIMTDVPSNQTITITEPDINLHMSAKIWLQGAYSTAGDSMVTSLKASLPLTSPYSDHLTVSSIPDSMVDWVYVKIRKEINQANVDSVSAFLSKHGYICSTSGSQGVSLQAMPGTYFLIIQHRNHLSVMSANTITLNTSTSELYDFSLSVSKYYSASAVQLESGVWGMCCGDINQDGKITSRDYVSWHTAMRAGSTGYQYSDLNFDAQISIIDFDLWRQNALQGLRSFVP